MSQIVRGAVQLPHGTGKTVTICVFAKGEDAEAAKQAGEHAVGVAGVNVAFFMAEVREVQEQVVD